MIVNATRTAIMAAIKAATKIYDPADVFVGVAEAIVDNGRNTVLADITPPAGAGVAARQAVTTWSDPYVRPNGQEVVDSPLLDFRPANATEATSVVGWYAADALVAGNLIAYGVFPASIPLPDEFASCPVIMRVVVDPNGTWDSTVVLNG